MRTMFLKLCKDKMAIVSLLFLVCVIIAGLFAQLIAPHDANYTSIANKYQPMSSTYWLGTDHLGRCIFSRLLYGIRTTFFLALLTMLITMTIGAFFGVVSGYFKGKIDQFFMRVCDIMLSFPSEVMILAVVGLLGPGIFNVIVASICVKWAWYTRMVRGIVYDSSNQNYILFSKTIGMPKRFILSKHVLPIAMPQIFILASLDTGWVILSISALSFLGLGVQAPTAEWGSMLSEARNVLLTYPEQMIAPGIAILLVVAALNYLGDSMSDVLDKKEAL